MLRAADEAKRSPLTVAADNFGGNFRLFELKCFRAVERDCAINRRSKEELFLMLQAFDSTW